MRLLREFIDFSQIDNYIKEGKDGEKNVLLKGIFGQAEVKNKNNRFYPLKIMEREHYKLQQRIATTGLTGELDHPISAEYTYSNAAMIILKLTQDKNDWIGEGKIINEGKGKLAYKLAKEGIKFGISSRSLGSLKEKNDIQYVCEDLNLITYDIVADPSAPNAWADSVLEQTEWIMDNSGYIKEDTALMYKKRLDSIPKEKLQEEIVKLFENFIREF